MWTIIHIFDGDYGCEEHQVAPGDFVVSVTLQNENGEKNRVTVTDAWLRKNNLDIGSVCPV